MEFLGNTWWIWLISGFGAIFVGVILHVTNIRRLHGRLAEATRDEIEITFDPRLPNVFRFFKRFGFAMFFFLIASVCEVLFVLGVIVRIIEMFKNGTGA